jgi:predicted aspartyl protease
MNISFENDQASLLIPTLNNDLEFSPLEFIIDTGFTGTIFFSVNDSWDIFKIFRCANINLLPQKDWVVFANGETAKTYSAEISLLINGENITFITRICKGKNIDTPLLGMRFLKFFQSRFVLDFQKKNYSLELKNQNGEL